MTFGNLRKLWPGIIVCILAVMTAQAQAQPQAQTETCVVEGHVRDSSGRLVSDAAVWLQWLPNTATDAASRTESRALSRNVYSDSAGVFRFSGLREGAYSLRAEVNGSNGTTPDGVAIVNSLTLVRNETKAIDLVLQHPSSESLNSPSSKTQRAPHSGVQRPDAQRPEFFDEPQFTVAGVSQATNSGGHGSDTVLRNSEALVRDTANLSGEASAKEASSRIASAGEAGGRNAGTAGSGSATHNAANGVSSETNELVASELVQEGAEIQAEILRYEQGYEQGRQQAEGGKVPGGSATADKTGSERISDARARQKQAELYHRLAQIDEKLNNPLEAVREYQRAAELAPSETNIFDWASELLTHRALEPATDVFAKGNALHPQSARLLIGLGVAWYARGSYDRAAQSLARASDLAPADATPYLFMGKMQSAEIVPSQKTVEKLARFVQLSPASALANYYYAVGLWKSKESAGALDEASSAQIETLLQKAIQIDPKLGAAQLQLGILLAQRGDYARAIPAYQKAAEVSPELEETHYRLAQAYKRTGDAANAEKELQLHEQLSKQAKEKTERERADIQAFVITLRDK